MRSSRAIIAGPGALAAPPAIVYHRRIAADDDATECSAGLTAAGAVPVWRLAARFLAGQLVLSRGCLELGRWVYHLTVGWVLADLYRWRAAAFAGHETVASVLIAAAVLACAGVLWRPTFRVAVVVLWALLKVLFALSLDGYTADQAIEVVSFVWMFAPAPGATRLGDGTPFALLIIVALGLLYLDSLPYKLRSVIWRQGSALWLGAALPLHGWGYLARWPQLALLSRLATWLTLAFEGLFLFALLRRLRPWLVATGVLMHLGSSLLLPLPQFGLALTGALLPLLGVPRRRPATVAGHAAGPRPLPAWSLALALLMIIGQVAVNHEPDARRDPVSALLGVRRWPIYLDWHFVLPGPVLRFRAETDGGPVWVPSFDGEGYPQVRDRYWKILGWVARSRPDGPAMIDRYLRAWFRMRGVAPRGVELWCRDPSVNALGIDAALVEEVRRRPWVRCGEWTPRRRQEGQR